jgi:hypothetical protein
VDALVVPEVRQVARGGDDQCALRPVAESVVEMGCGFVKFGGGR